jgi:hypothetical protein
MSTPQPDRTPGPEDDTNRVLFHSKDSIDLFEDVVVILDPRPLRPSLRQPKPKDQPPPGDAPTEHA